MKVKKMNNQDIARIYFQDLSSLVEKAHAIHHQHFPEKKSKLLLFYLLKQEVALKIAPTALNQRITIPA